MAAKHLSQNQLTDWHFDPPYLPRNSFTVVWPSGNDVRHIGVVALYQAQLVLGLVTMSEFSSQWGTFTSV